MRSHLVDTPTFFPLAVKHRHFASFERQKQENSDHEKAYLRLFHGEAVSNIEFETAPFFYFTSDMMRSYAAISASVCANSGREVAQMVGSLPSVP